jgi:hypothetical protein
MHAPAVDEMKPAKEQKEDSNMKAAGKISEEIGRSLSREQRKKAGPWIHAFGAFVGAVLGLAAEVEPDPVRRINPVFVRAAYGIAVFPAAHEIAVPAPNLSSNPHSRPNRGIRVALSLWHRHDVDV